MRIHFHGAAGDVTGSAYHVVTKDASVLVDCGFFQGKKEESAKNRRKASLEGGKLDAVLLTHGHLDHIGRLPLLTRNGYKGPVYGTRPTLDIATLILKDSLGLQKQDLKRENARRAKAKLPPLEPLFEEPDVRKLKPLATPIRYHQKIDVAPGIQARFVDAGHVIGSASIELTVNEIRRLINVLQIRPTRSIAYRLRWSNWRRRHQERARRAHYARRLNLELQP